MSKKRGKSISFDAMVKFFMQSYGIPTKRDIEKVMDRLDQLEELIKTTARLSRVGRNLHSKSVRGGRAGDGMVKTASETVLNTIRAANAGIGFADIQQRVGFDDKKLRNIIFRLNKTGKIRRVRRGLYMIRG